MQVCLVNLATLGPRHDPSLAPGVAVLHRESIDRRADGQCDREPTFTDARLGIVELEVKLGVRERSFDRDLRVERGETELTAVAGYQRDRRFIDVLLVGRVKRIGELLIERAEANATIGTGGGREIVEAGRHRRSWLTRGDGDHGEANAHSSSLRWRSPRYERELTTRCHACRPVIASRVARRLFTRSSRGHAASPPTSSPRLEPRRSCRDRAGHAVSSTRWCGRRR